MSEEPTSATVPGMSPALFWPVQASMLILLLGVFVLRDDTFPRLPSLRSAPLEVRPLYDDPSVVSDEQLRRVLRRLGVRFDSRSTSVGALDHSLRFVGPGFEFPDEGFMDGRDLLAVLTDHRRFAQAYGRGERPLLTSTPEGGVRVRTLEGLTSSAHHDHLMAGLAEVGTHLDDPIRTAMGAATYGDMVVQSLRDFSLNQAEYEWSALAYALLVRPGSDWVSGEGQRLDFDRLVDRIMRERLPSGVCSANHRLHALVMILRVDGEARRAGETGFLTAAARERVMRYLVEITSRFVRHQHPDGFWNGDWPTAAPQSSVPTERLEDTLAVRMIVTGHVLEWWALAPESLQPPRPVVAAAGQWLVRTIDGLSDEEIQANYSYLSHVGRALALWRGLFPAEVDLSRS